MRDLAMVLRALWFRRGTSAAVLLVATVVIGGAATGPLFLRASGESVLRDTLDSGTLVRTRMVGDSVTTQLSSDPVEVVERSRERLRRYPTLHRLLAPPVAGLRAEAVVAGAGHGVVKAQLVFRDDQCAHLRAVQGRCPQRPGELMASEFTGVQRGWRTGARVTVDGRPMRVVGTYRPQGALSDYWANRAYFDPLGEQPPRVGPPRVTDGYDGLFTVRATITSLPRDSLVEATLDRSLRVDRIRLADLPALRSEIHDYEAEGAREPGSDGRTGTAIPIRLDQASQVVSTLTAPVVVVGAQLLVLCWLVLFLVVANGAEARGPEVALAKLRGLPSSATVVFGLLDSVLLVALATPLGLAAAYGGVTLLAHGQLAPHTPVALTTATVVAALVAAAGAATAAVLAGIRTLRRPVVEQWRRTSRQRRVRTWLVDGLAVAVAVAGVVALLRSPALAGGRNPSPWALLAPGLVVLAAALVGSRVLPPLCRAWFAPTGRRRWLGAYLAVRQVARRPATLRLALVLAVGIGLVTFAVDAWAVGRQNAHDRAWTEVGAAVALDVQVPPGVDLGEVVDRVDPSGRHAAVVSEIADYDDVPPVWLLAVQSRRFAHVAFWREDLGPPLAGLAEELRPRTAPPVRLDGDRLTVTVDVRALSAPQPVHLVVDLGYVDGGSAPLDLGALRPGRQVLRAALPCRHCYLDGLYLDRPAGTFFPYRATFGVTAVEVVGATGRHDVEADLDHRQWRAVGEGASTPIAPGLTLVADASDTDTPAWGVADRPVVFPALVTRAARTAGARDEISGLDGQPLPMRPVSVGPALPGAGSLEVVVDRDFALRATTGNSYAQNQVWLSSTAPKALERRLDDAGVTVLGRTSAAEQTRLYQRQGPELALLLFLCGAGLAAALAAGGCVLTSYLSGRRRTYEIVALRSQGLRARTLFVALAGEQALLLLFGIATGAAAGLLGAWLSLPAIPEFADDPTAPPMLYDVHATVVLLTLAGVVLVLAVVVALSSLGLVRGARFAQLREAPA